MIRDASQAGAHPNKTRSEGIFFRRAWKGGCLRGDQAIFLEAFIKKIIFEATPFVLSNIEHIPEKVSDPDRQVSLYLCSEETSISPSRKTGPKKKQGASCEAPKPVIYMGRLG